MGVIGKITAGGTTYPLASCMYGTCATAAGTAEKAVVLADYDISTPLTGMTIHVKFDNTNTASAPTLNINSKGAKTIKAYGTTAPGTSTDTGWKAGEVVSFTYDGTYWQMNDYIPNSAIPSNNVTGSGTSGNLAKFSGANTITDGPALGSSTTTYLRNDGSWATPANTDTKVNMIQRGTTKSYLLGTTTAPTSSNQAVTSVAETGVYFDTTAATVVATTFKGALTGTASGNLTSSSTLDASKLSGAIPSAVTATTQASTDNSTKLATTAYVTTAIDNLPEPMVFKGSVGTGGTITSLPTAAASNEGWTYKVITALSSPAAKVGDTVISNGSSWVVIPSGDEPSGTVTSVGVSNGGGLSVSGSPVTSSGTITVSHADTSSQASSSNSGRTYIQSVTLDTYGHVTGLSTATETVTNTDYQLQLSEVGSSSTYYPVVGNGNTAQSRQYDTTGWIYSATNGTTSSAGNATITLGNNKTATTTNNKQGKIVLYGSTAYTHTIEGAPTAARTITLPDNTGTVALTSQIPSITLNGSASTSPSFYSPTGAGTSGQYLKSSGSGAPTWANFPTIPSITLNGSASTSPSFYAPTGAGTSGQYLKSSGSGAPTWASFPTIPSITLNGSASTSPSFYAPTGAGTSGQYLKSSGSGAPTWTNFPSIPSITLNGSATTSPSFYAPTSAGTSGYYLKSSGSGAPTWASIPTSSDTKVTQDYSTTNNSYPLLMTATAGTSSTSSRGATTAILNNYLSYNPSSQTLDSEKIATNNLDAASITTGQLQFANGNGTATIDTSYLTDERVIVLPDVDGELATLDDIPPAYSLPLAANGTRGGVQIGYSESGTNYAVKLSSEKAYVTVPWTDTKVTVAALTSGTNYYPILATGTGTNTRQIDSTLGALKYNVSAGTTSVTGTAKLILGNSTATGTANNVRGQMTIYGSTAYAHTIQGAPTAARTITLPDNTGTVALTSDVPSITLNGSGSTSPSFYAPTTAGTSGYYLKSNGSGAPTWTAFPTIPTMPTYTVSDETLTIG